MSGLNEQIIYDRSGLFFDMDWTTIYTNLGMDGINQIRPY
jgi:hypothetical protein